MTGTFTRFFARLQHDRKGAVGLTFAIMYGLIAFAFSIALNQALAAMNQTIVLGAIDNALTVEARLQVGGLSSSIVSADRDTILATMWAVNGGPTACASGTSTNGVANGVPTWSYPSAGSISITVQCASAFGFSATAYTVTATVQVQGYNIEVAMVLDNTGSMAGTADGTTASYTNPTKITGLKQAAVTFLSILQGSANAGAGVVKVGMVPFTTDVNIVNPGDPNQSSVQIGNTLATQATIVNFAPQIYSDLITVATCTDPNNYVMQVPTVLLTYNSQMQSNTYSCPRTRNGVTTYRNTSQSWYTMPAVFDSTTWLGCVVDRDQAGNPTTNTSGNDYSISNTLPVSGTVATLFPADNINCGDYTLGPLAMIPLQDIYYQANLQLLNDRLLCRPDNDSTCNPPTASKPTGWVDICTIASGTLSSSCNSGTTSVTVGGTATNKTGMLANGNTNLTIGLVWGWQMLTPGFTAFPSANRAVGGAGVKQFIVFFTDGQNTENRFTFTAGPNSSPYTAGTINAETIAVCNAIKAANITLFTIGTTDADTTLLNACATSGDAYTNQTASSLQATFQNIAGQISLLRFSQ